MADNTQIYITGVQYNSSSYPDDEKNMFDDVSVNFKAITNFTYGFLSINRAENRLSSGTTREQLLIFLKDVVYGGNTYLTEANAAALRTAIITKLALIPAITYTDVEIRTTRST